MMSTVETCTPWSSADSSSATPSASSPDGITGSVNDTDRSARSFCSSAIASDRNAIESESANSSPSMSKSACAAPAASSAAPYAFASAEALPQVAPSSFPEDPPKETRTEAPDFFSAAMRDFTAALPRAYWAFHFATQSSPSEMTKARLYVEGEPAVSMPTAVVALTYGS
ncbi:hypothetical protein QFZ63_003610 [Streptomyces sp. B3I7]|nr:hypothetical protein [Streptomyces sp. B3I7]